ncbi:hypothetical protein LC605_32630, partial [Nostoc sp. CHAB 5836]|uniref:hypothetical protein n=1 Tax=Nostoc sp. CHAB 5836 TaxID=2780404 RepID=UPI001E626035
DPFKIKFPIKPILLIPPFRMLSNMLWTRGYVINIRNEPIQNVELLPRHVFESMTIHRYVDEYGKPVPPPKDGDVVGNDSFEGWGSFDSKISNAIGVAAHPSHE